MIKDNFVLGYSLKEILLIAVIGAITFYIFQNFGKSLAYQWTVTIIIFIAALLMEVPTTQQRFIDIILKAIRYVFVEKIYIQDTRRKWEEDN